MPAVLALLSKELTPLIVGLRATEYMLVACAALWTYDYFLTVDREIALVWRSRWSFGKVIFFLNRYTPIMPLILGIYTFRGKNVQGDCRRLVKIGFWSYLIGFFWSEIILAMRAWAIWGGTRAILIAITIFSLIMITCETVLMNRLIELGKDIPIPKPLVPILGLTCAPLVEPHDLLWPEFLVLMVNETVVTVMALSRGFQHYRELNDPLIETMFHDGLLYYIYTLAITIANVIVTLTAPIQWAFFLEQPLGILCSIFATRVLLNIRGAYFQPENNTYGAKSTGLDFQWTQVGAVERNFNHGTLSRSDTTTSSSLSEGDFNVVEDGMDGYGYHQASGQERTRTSRISSGQGWIWTDSPSTSA